MNKNKRPRVIVLIEFIFAIIKFTLHYSFWVKNDHFIAFLVRVTYMQTFYYFPYIHYVPMAIDVITACAKCAMHCQKGNFVSLKDEFEQFFSKNTAITKRRNSGPEFAEIPPEFFDFFCRNIPPEFAKRRNVHENP
jgi:hypothetical protein